jgi:phage shock protein PspC (stress-responsive transcriptional regulator)
LPVGPRLGQAQFRPGENEPATFVVSPGRLVRRLPERERSIVMALSLVRPRERWIAGVCSGLARRFDVSPATVRLVFVISCLLPGPQFLLYIALWILMPSE